MNKWTVLNSLRQLLPLDKREADIALPLCSNCLEEIRENLREDADPQDIRIATAAAGLAYYKLMVYLLADDGNVSSFRAGDITVKQDSKSVIKIAENVRNDALLRAVPILRDKSFIFRQVDV